LFDIGYYVVDVFGSRRDTNVIGRDAGCKLFGFIELLMGCAGWVNYQSFTVADVGKVTG
jgi:hypothetical protein